jgi:hypothetical protein
MKKTVLSLLKFVNASYDGRRSRTRVARSGPFCTTHSADAEIDYFGSVYFLINVFTSAGASCNLFTILSPLTPIR